MVTFLYGISGIYFCISSSIDSLPCSCSIKIHIAVNCLLTEARLKDEFVCKAAPVLKSATPKAFLYKTFPFSAYNTVPLNRCWEYRMLNVESSSLTTALFCACNKDDQHN